RSQLDFSVQKEKREKHKPIIVRRNPIDNHEMAQQNRSNEIQHNITFPSDSFSICRFLRRLKHIPNWQLGSRTNRSMPRASNYNFCFQQVAGSQAKIKTNLFGAPSSRISNIFSKA